jgi:hypothetical protein
MCTNHNLWFATNPTYSQDGTKVYVICGCEQRRVVPHEEWEAEQARRLRNEAGCARPDEQTPVDPRGPRDAWGRWFVG